MNFSNQNSELIPLKLEKPKAKKTKKQLRLKALSNIYNINHKKYIKFWEKLNKKSKEKTAKKLKQKAVYGTLNIKCAKRTIYFTLSDYENKLLAVISTGHLGAKGKTRKAIYFIRILANSFVKLILETNKSLKLKKAYTIKKIHLVIQGYLPRRIKRIFLNAFKSQKKQFKIYKLTRRLKNPHNGCRPPKKRRK